MFFPAAARVISSCTGATAPWTNASAAPGIAGSARCVNTQHGDVAVVPRPLRGLLEQTVVGQHPLVRRRTHRHRADLGEERLEGVGAVALPIDLEEPVEEWFSSAMNPSSVAAV